LAKEVLGYTIKLLRKIYILPLALKMGGEPLKRLGTGLHVVQKRLIVRGELAEERTPNVPRANSIVVDQKRTKIGRVFDVFGPVDRPYFVVRPNKGIDAAAQVNRKLYVEETSGRDGKWKR
jgi:RNA-binding protein